MAETHDAPPFGATLFGAPGALLGVPGANLNIVVRRYSPNGDAVCEVDVATSPASSVAKSEPVLRLNPEALQAELVPVPPGDEAAAPAAIEAAPDASDAAAAAAASASPDAAVSVDDVAAELDAAMAAADDSGSDGDDAVAIVEEVERAVAERTAPFYALIIAAEASEDVVEKEKRGEYYIEGHEEAVKKKEAEGDDYYTAKLKREVLIGKPSVEFVSPEDGEEEMELAEHMALASTAKGYKYFDTEHAKRQTDTDKQMMAQIDTRPTRIEDEATLKKMAEASGGHEDTRREIDMMEFCLRKVRKLLIGLEVEVDAWSAPGSREPGWWKITEMEKHVLYNKRGVKGKCVKHLQNGEVVDQSWKLTFTLSWRARAHSGEYRGKIECKDIEHDTFRDSYEPNLKWDHGKLFQPPNPLKDQMRKVILHGAIWDAVCDQLDYFNDLLEDKQAIPTPLVSPCFISSSDANKGAGGGAG